MKKIIKAFVVAIAVLSLGLAGFVWWYLQPRPEPRELPADIVSLEAPRGQALLANAEAAADYGPLSRHFVPQSLKSYCGVASAVTVLSALGEDVRQESFFTDETSGVRSRLQVTLGGMSLEDLAGLLRAHGAEASIHRADSFTADQFRETVSTNLSSPGDYLVVNYQREVLGQSRVGHISPLAAYDADSDRVLVLDTASYFYPHSWVRLNELYAAMATIDPSTGKMRGYLSVTQHRGGK
jgi:hypothetical protein